MAGKTIQTFQELELAWPSLPATERQKILRVWRAWQSPLYWLTKATKTRDDQDEKNPYKPFPERAFFHDLYAAWRVEPVIFVEKSRTMMLTWLFAGFCLHAMMIRPATTVIFWAQDEDRALKPLDYAWVLWEQQDIELKDIWPVARARERQSYNRMELANESYALALPGKDPDKIRSEHPSILFVDEACFIERGGEAFDVALASRVPKVVAISSAAPSWFREISKGALPETWAYK